MTIRVLVVDDQAIVRDGLVTVLSLVPDLQVVGQAADGAEAIAAVDRHVPDVVLMDLRMPGVDGPTATARIVAEHPGVAVLVLTTYADDDSVVDRAAGGSARLPDEGRRAGGDRDRGAGGGRRAVDLRRDRGGAAGGAPRRWCWCRPAGAAPGSAAPAGADPGRSLGARFPDLTPREVDVLERIADGRTNPQIAAELFLTVPTVKSYVNQVFAKLGVRTRAEAVARVLR